jgi:hypothetical protein
VPDAVFVSRPVTGLEKAALCLLLLAYLLPVWWVGPLPTQDGATHVDNANILLHYSASPLYQQFYTLNPLFETNRLGHLLLAAFLMAFSPLLAEKLTVSLYLSGMVLGLFFAFRRVGRRVWPTYLFALPWIYNYLFHMGFYNFVLSLPVLLVMLGMWWTERTRSRLPTLLCLSGLSLLLYLAHIFAAGALGVTVGLLTLWEVGLECWKARAWRVPDVPVRQVLLKALDERLPTLLALGLPLLVLGLQFVGGYRDSTVVYAQPEELWKSFSQNDLLVSYLRAEEGPRAGLLLAGVLLLGLLGGIQRIFRPSLRATDGFLLAALALLAVWHRAPRNLAEGGFISERILLCAFLIYFLWLASLRFSKPLRGVITSAGLVFALWTPLAYGQYYARLEPYLQDLQTVATQLPEGSVFLSLPLHFRAIEPDTLLSERVAVLLHPPSYVAAERHAVDLANYEAAFTRFPVSWQGAVRPSERLQARLEGEQAYVSIARYEQETGVTVDYVLVWGTSPARLETVGSARILAQLEARFELQYTSPDGLARLYRHRPGGEEGEQDEP